MKKTLVRFFHVFFSVLGSFFVWPEWSHMKKTLVRFFHVNFLRTWEFFCVAGVELHEKNSCEVFSCKFSPYLGVFLGGRSGVR